MSDTNPIPLTGVDWRAAIAASVYVYSSINGMGFKTNKVLRQAARKVAQDENVAEAAVGVSLQLFPEWVSRPSKTNRAGIPACGPNNEFIVCRRACRAVARLVDSYAAPTGVDGQRIMFQNETDKFDPLWIQAKDAAYATFADLLGVWHNERPDGLLYRASLALNGHFDPKDYRTLDKLQAEFLIDRRFELVQDGSYFGRLRSQVLQAAGAEADERARTMLANSASALGTEMLSRIRTIADRLSSPTARVNQLQEFVDGLKEMCLHMPTRLNILHDSVLNQAASDVKSVLDQIDMSGIAENMEVRASLAEAATAMANRYSGLGNRRFD